MSAERERFGSHKRRGCVSADGEFRSTCVERKRFTYESRIVFCHGNCVSLDGGRAKCENTETAPFGNIPDCHTWTEGSIIVQKRPFGTFAFGSAFSHPGLGLVNILDSKKYQTGFQINSPEIKNFTIGKILSEGHAP